MKRTAESTPSRPKAATKPTTHAKPGSTPSHQLSAADRAFIRAMNEFVEKHGTITDDEFFRVL
ncbi:TPA: hypothetical protein ACYRWO_001121 [Enterobacter hormaechei]|uniref:Uncharacterized protein n=1 Tax=Enterobacter hormaechei subsp. steigerwaltii TaxID=299766 RepID=A0AAE4J3Z9_9ENTR|nr:MULTISPECIES: hypothetical protein [Enterobacter]TZG30505.1 hypothetical protein FYF90_01065 [Enterobacter sp. RVSM5a]AWV76134.1 hypothetical protein DN066_12315 [Enterobacter hormaechei subsp. xiangfangensis]EHF5034010.1 hypothetical protein [Enterobacter hormaechei]EHF5062552.1 hypothetical protein [Enterobacter hormaechei]EKK5507845.1 hypothetical protein [Enterobacter hormaechei]